MRTDRFFVAPATWRSIGLRVIIAALGIVAIVGSGGGISLGFPPCTASFCTNDPIPPAPTLNVLPPYRTVQVGATVTWTAVAANFTESLSYQWSRSNDDGKTWVDIAGATGLSYTVAGVNLADDGALFVIVARPPSGFSLHATAQLLVSATPGVVFEDGDFQDTDWQVAPIFAPSGFEPGHQEQHLDSGGHPGAFRKMQFQLVRDAGVAGVGYLSDSAVYKPQLSGAVRVLDHAEDCIAFQRSDSMWTESYLLIEQGQRLYASNQSGICNQTAWSATAVGRASLLASDFRLLAGPACTTGEACPDFAATGLPLRFGYWRLAWGMPGDSIGHGIDNWKVTVWRR